MTDKPRTLVVVSHTHWDREWYQPFEAMRVRLVRMLDRLLDLLEREPEFRHFVLDGQTIALEDYLEVRPQRRPQVERLVREGRLLIGPNYVLPDEFLIGGESWVRNLQIGIRTARELGGAMMVGYSPDAFGHIAHLPAVLRGFGIDSVVLWRGVGPEATASEFRWAAPDGSEVLALHLPYGYAIGRDLPVEPSGLKNRLQTLLGLLEPLAATRYLLLPNGDDHAGPQEELPRALRTARELFPDLGIVHGHYPMLVEAIGRELEGHPDRLPRLEGELRSSARSHVLAGVLSARMWIKQRYQECEDLLARWAEPLSAWAHLLRQEGASPAASDRDLLAQAWKLLLQNAPHDSICGCSIDQVHEEMRVRFDRCQALAEAVLRESMRSIADRAAGPEGTYVVVFNSENGPRTDFCTVLLPAEDGRLPARLVGEGGQAVPLQPLQRGLRSPRDRRERVRVGFLAPEVPPFGYRALRVEYGEPPPPAPSADAGGIENEFFRLTADPGDGTLTLLDKGTGALLRGLNRFADGGDRGDEYTYCPPRRDEVIDRPARPPAVRVTEAGPARWTLQVALDYALPRGLSEDRDARSRERVECRIVSRASLYPGVPRIDIETEVENRAQDHRLRACFPTGLRADATWAEQHFGVVRRPIALPPAGPTDWETPVGTFPQKSFVSVSDGERGFTLANRGLPEYEALREADGTVTLALTLLRCVGWLSRPDLRTRRGPAGPALEAPGAQMPGRWRFHYSLIPHRGGWEAALPQAHRFARPLRAVRTAGGRGEAPAAASLLEIEPEAIALSALRLAEGSDGLAVRVYNTSGGPVQGWLRLLAPHRSVQRADLMEEPLEPAESEDGRVWLRLRPNEIATLVFTER